MNLETALALILATVLVHRLLQVLAGHYGKRWRFMGMELRDVLNGERTVPVTVEGAGTFDVTYRPFGDNGKWQKALGKATRKLEHAARETDPPAEEGGEPVERDPDVIEKEVAKAQNEWAKVLREVILDWDITLDGKKLGVTGEAMDLLPDTIFAAVMDTVQSDNQGGDEEDREEAKKG